MEPGVARHCRSQEASQCAYRLTTLLPRDPASTDFCSGHGVTATPVSGAGARFAVGIWLVFLGGLLLSDGYLWATLLLMAAALLFWVGYLNMAADRSAPPQV